MSKMTFRNEFRQAEVESMKQGQTSTPIITVTDEGIDFVLWPMTHSLGRVAIPMGTWSSITELCATYPEYAKSIKSQFAQYIRDQRAKRY